MTALRRAHGFPGGRDAVLLGLTLPRARLYARIERRVDAMIETGWVAETEALLAAGVGPEAPGMNALGYRELACHIRGEMALETAVLAIKKASRNYAKRQFTWFRNDARIRWLAADSLTVQGLVGRVFESNHLGEIRVDVPIRKAP